MSPLRGIRPCMTASTRSVGGLRVDLPEAAVADPPGAVGGALADEGAAVDAVDAAGRVSSTRSTETGGPAPRGAAGRPGAG